MTQSKAYNLKVYCDLKKIDIETEEAEEFLSMTFYEQLLKVYDYLIVNRQQQKKKKKKKKIQVIQLLIELLKNKKYI